MSSVKEFYRTRYANLDTEKVPARIEPNFRLAIQRALSAIDASPKRILDFGCFIGASSELFAEAGHHVLGVDISEPVIEMARARVFLRRPFK